MKKILAIMSAMIMTIALCSIAVAAEYDSTQSTVVQISSVSGQKGKTVDVTVSVQNNPGISSISLDISFDESKLNLTKVEFNSDLGGQTGISESMKSPVTIQWVNAFSDWKEDGVFATLTFSISEDVENNTETAITVSYDPENIYNHNEENVTISINNGTVSIIPLAGDINGDGKVNNKDVTRLFQHLANWSVFVNQDVLDVNGDGKVNNKDITRLMQYLANWDVKIYYNTVHTHTYGEWTSSGDSTHERLCSCGDKQLEAHVWDAGTIIDEATATKDGTKQYICSVCGETKTVIIPATGYTVTFFSDDQVLKIENVNYGEAAVAPSAPEKDGYRFSHWDKDFSNVTNNMEISAVFVKTYTIDFVDYNYAVISSQIVDAGGNATAPSDPARKNYKFTGWSGEYQNVIEDAIVQATYVRVYNVTFVDKSNQILKKYNDVEIGTNFSDLIDIPAVPNVEGYTGVWGDMYTDIREDKVISPVYTVNKYKVRFEMPNGEVIKYIDVNGIEHDYQEVEHGSFAVDPGHPEYLFSWQNYRGYGFTRWSGGFDRITSDTTITAVYDSPYDKPIIAVKYRNENGKLSPTITLCNLADVQLYGISFKIKYATNSSSYGISVDKVNFNPAADWLKSGDQELYDIEINNKTKEMHFAWSNGNGVQINPYGDFITGMSISTSGGAEADFVELFRIDESECSLIISCDGGATFEKVTPIIIYE